MARTADFASQVTGAVRRVLQSVSEGPVVVRIRPTAAGLLRGRLAVVRAELRGVATSGLVVDEVVIRGTEVRIAPGFPARLRADSTTVGMTVLQRSVDRWLMSSILPFSVSLDEDAVRGRAQVAGFSMGEVELDVTVSNGLLVLRPRSATVMGMNAPGARLFRTFLPLPALPSGTTLVKVRHGPGRITLVFDTGPLDEPLSPDLPERLRRRLLMSTEGGRPPAAASEPPVPQTDPGPPLNGDPAPTDWPPS